MFWHAKVDCIESFGGKDNKTVRVKRRFVLEADDSEAAWSAAQRAGEAGNTFGPRLLAVEVRSVASVTLPFEIEAP